VTDDHAATTENIGVRGMASDDPKRWAALAVIAVAQLMIIVDASIESEKAVMSRSKMK
jgi:hypothetical protein